MKDQFAFSILLFAFPLLFRKGLKSKIGFAIGVLAAMLFHPSYVLFLAFLAPPLFRKKPKLVLSLSVIILSFSLLLILSGQQRVLTSVYNTFSGLIQVNDRYEKYFQTTSRLAPLAIVLIFILLLLLLRYWSKKCVKDKIPKHTGLFETNKQMLLPIFITACIFVPLLILNMTAYRYIRDLCLIGIIISGIGCSNAFITRKQRIAILAMSSMISIGLFIYDIPVKGYWNDFVKSFFDNAYWN